MSAVEQEVWQDLYDIWMEIHNLNCIKTETEDVTWQQIGLNVDSWLK